MYVEKLIKEDVVPPEYFADQILKYNDEMSNALILADKYQPDNFHFKDRWSSCGQARDDVITTWDTGMLMMTINFRFTLHNVLSFVFRFDCCFCST